jgi:hypothetical protein
MAIEIPVPLLEAVKEGRAALFLERERRGDQPTAKGAVFSPAKN